MRYRPIRWLYTLLLALSLATVAHAQLNENCVVSILNRTVQVRPDGTWVLPNIPANFGQIRARATCVENAITRSGQSDLFSIPTNGSVDIPRIQLGAVVQIPASLTLTAPNTTLATAGETAQLTVTARFPDGSTQNVSARNTGTSYTNSNTRVATVSSDGLVTALSSGTVIISALHEGALGLLQIRVTLSGADVDGDGIPDDIETANGLNPNDPTDGFTDLDGDGLTNKQELMDFGTNFQVADTDGDGITDGEEVQAGVDGFVTNPLLRDTDGDGINDRDEITGGSDPTDPNSRPGLTALQVSPINLTLTVNTILGEASQRLTVTGRRADGGTVDLTADSGTNYASSDLTVCNFGGERGRVFAGAAGACTITVTNSGLSAQAFVSVTTFAPVALATIAIPGYANNVDASGNFVYVAAGATGLQVVGVSNPRIPLIVGSLNTPGNANDVRIVGELAFIADGSSGLQIIDIDEPASPILVGSLDTPGEAQDVMIAGTHAYVADGAAGLQIINVSNPAAPSLVGTVDTAGTARGVDVVGTLAVVADGPPANAVRIINVSNPASPQLVGSVAIPGDVKDVVARDTFAYVAAFNGGLQVVDFTTPTNPRIVGSLPSSFTPRDVELAGQFALFAEQVFPNAVPIVDVTTPAAPLFRANLNFAPLGDYAGTGIALRPPFVYMTGESFIVRSENGATGNTRLFIGQYLAQEDKAGIPPTVRIVTPAAGETVIEGATLPVTVEASDDVAVAAVNVSVNGVVVASDSTSPYQVNLTVPVGVASLTLGVSAGDIGGNVGVGENVVVTVIPDPGTTATGRVVSLEGNPVAGATVTCIDKNGVTGTEGTFSIPNVPTVRGEFHCTATATVDGSPQRGISLNKFPVVGGETVIGDIIISAGDINLWISANGNWTDASRWSAGVVPGPSHHAIVNAPGAYTLTLNTNAAVTSFTMDAPAATFSLAGRTFSVNLNSLLKAGTVVLNNATWTGNGLLTNKTTILAQGSSTLSVSRLVGGTLWVQGGALNQEGFLSLADGLRNEGVIRLESVQAGGYRSGLFVNGTFTNAAAGVIEVNAGAGGTSLVSGRLINDGTIRVGPGVSMTLDQVVNRGTIAVDPTGQLLITGSYEAAGGTITGPGYVRSVPLQVTGSPAAATTILLAGGPTLTTDNLANTTLWVQGGALNQEGFLSIGDGLRNEGVIRLESVQAGGYRSGLFVNGTFTNAAAGVIEVNAGAGGSSLVSGRLVNDGTIRVGPGVSMTLDQVVNRGTIAVDPTGQLLITGSYEAAGGTITGPGYVRSVPLQVTGSPAAATTILLAGGPTLTTDNLANTTLWVQGGVLNQEGFLYIADGLRNEGVIRLESVQAGGYRSGLIVTGTFTNAATGVIEVNVGAGGSSLVSGRLINEGTIRVGPGVSMTLEHVVNRGTIEVDPTGQLLIIGSYEAAGGTISGPGYVQNIPLQVTVAPAASTRLLLAGSPTLTTNNLANMTLWVQGGALNQEGFLYIGDGLRNEGVIRLESVQAGGYRSGLFVNGTFTNAATGVIEVNVGAGGSSLVSGRLVNEGTIRVGPGVSMTLEQVVNRGTIEVDPTGQLLITGSYEAAGGTISGPGYVQNVPLRVTAPPAAPTTILLAGNPTLTTDNLANTTLWVQGGALNQEGFLYIADGLKNEGMIRLESVQTGGYRSGLVVNSVNGVTGTFTNAAAGVIEVNAGAGGTRFVSGRLINEGLIRVQVPTTVDVFTQTATGTLALTVGDSSSGQLNVAGTATLDGTLTISLAAGFTPNLGDTFQIVSFASRTGQFATINGLNIGGGLAFEANYSATGLTLITVSAAASPQLAATRPDVSFGSAVAVPLGDSSIVPVAVAAADLNGDSVIDLVTANATTNDVSVMLGRGDGAFQAPRRFAVGTAPVSLVTADINRDGKVDIVTTNEQSHDVSVLSGNGDGTFQDQHRFTVGTNPSSTVVADVNRDGALDLVTANQGDAAKKTAADVSVLLGKGNGMFQSEQRFVAGDRPLSVAVGDINKDNALDLVMANGISGDVSVLFGVGDGTFQAQRLITAGTTPTAVTLVDVDHDKTLDIVVTDADAGDISILPNTGDGTFAPRRRFAVGSTPVAVVVIDVNRDNMPDLVTANAGSDDVSVLTSTGNASFHTQQRITVGIAPRALAAADLNGDGALDLVTANSGSGDVSVVLHK